jgi:hypothetical protein
MIKQQKWIDMIQLGGGNASDEPHAGTFEHRSRLDDPGHISHLMLHAIYLDLYGGSGFKPRSPDKGVLGLYSRLEAAPTMCSEKLVCNKTRNP